MVTISLKITVLILFLLLSAFFSASETALFSIPRERMLYFQNKKSKRYYWVYMLMIEGQRTLLLILLGNTFINITLAALIHTLLSSVLPHGSTLLSLAIATIVIVLFGEMLPKNIALKNNEKIAITISPILYHLELFLTPMLKIIQKINLYFFNFFKSHLRMPSPFITIEELKTGIQQSAQNGAISSQEQDMIIGILEQGSEPVRNIMVHRSKLLIFPEDTAVEQVQKKMSLAAQKLVVVRSKSDSRQIKGIVHIRDCIGVSINKSIGLLIKSPIVWVPETMETADLISFLLTEKCEDVCIIDQFGCFSGIISLSSCFSDLINDAFNNQSEIVKTDEPRIFDGIQDISLIAEWLPRSLVSSLPNVRTLNGLLTNYMGEIPKSGDRVEIDGYMFYIIKSSPTRIESVLISRGK